MNVWRNKGIRVGEVWFDEEPAELRVDVVYYHQRSHPIEGLECEEFPTIWIDLSGQPDELLAHVGDNARYKIKRAADKDQLVYEVWDGKNSEAIGRFYEFYDRFALQKSLPRINRRRLTSLSLAGTLTLSEIRTSEGVPLVWHAYVRAGNRAGLINSASHFREHADPGYRNMIGRANRYHHWRDMLKFKAEGVGIYDFGGWYPGDKDQEKLRINRFKEEFGGTLVKNYNLRRAVTLKGRVALWGARLMHSVGRA